MYAKQMNDGVAIANTQIDNTWVEITDIPKDRTYRDAWILSGSTVDVDATKKAEIDLVLFKQSRDEAVENITVVVDSMTFDGDEVSQSRMARAVASSSPGETTQWKLHDNTIVTITHEQLKQALRLAGEAQTALWMGE